MQVLYPRLVARDPVVQKKLMRPADRTLRDWPGKEPLMDLFELYIDVLKLSRIDSLIKSCRLQSSRNHC